MNITALQLYDQFSLGAGATASGTAGAWSSTNYSSATGAVSVVGTNAATWYVTGVQLEKGSTATTFDVRSYGTELALCQRYYYKTFPGIVSGQLSTSACCNTTTTFSSFGQFPVTMRTAPTALEQNGTANNYQFSGSGLAISLSAVPTITSTTSASNWQINGTVASGLTIGYAGVLKTDTTNGATAYLGWSAEL